MQKHTPGEWYMKHGDGWADVYADDGHGRIARIYMRGSKTNNLSELAGNIALITAAPELLEAVKEIAGHAEKYGAAPASATKMFDRARAAIAKAEGK